MKTIPFLLVYFLLVKFDYGQTCGFGCLGLSGVYAGYSINYYNLDGLNNFINFQSEISKVKKIESNFEQGLGYRIGANLIRAKIQDYFFSFKVFYQLLKEEQKIEQTGYDILIDNYKLSYKSFGIGIDFGKHIYKPISLKIIEIGFTHNSFSLNNNTTLNGIIINDIKYESESATIGYYFASGVIADIIKDYISLEITIEYNFTSTNKLVSESITIPDVNKDSGSLNYLFQLNIGMPL